MTQETSGISDLYARLSELVNERYPNSDEPGCAVLVVRGDDTQVITVGLATIAPVVAVTPQTNFRLASVAKQFTAASILVLRDEGRLALSQTIADFYPDFPKYGSSITVENLLRHTSGIKDYEPIVAATNPPQPVMDREVMALLAAETATDFEPGSRFRYSNSGYAVLTMIVEAVAGESYPDFLTRQFFAPLGMSNTLAFDCRPGKPAVSNRALGHNLSADGAWCVKDQSETSAVLGDGGIYTSALDYEKWIRAYMKGNVLKKSTLLEAWAPGLTTAGDTVPYGYGWRLEPQDHRGTTYYRPYHPGSTTGFRNGVIVNYKADTAVLVLTNRSSGDAVALAKALEAELVGSTN